MNELKKALDDIAKMDLGPLPKVHPRIDVVGAARRKLGSAIDEMIEDHQLTRAELLLLLTECVYEKVAQAVRIERGR